MHLVHLQRQDICFLFYASSSTFFIFFCIIFATIDRGKIFASYFCVLASCLGFNFLNAKDAKDGLMQ
jgi:hypothetical protein